VKQIALLELLLVLNHKFTLEIIFQTTNYRDVRDDITLHTRYIPCTVFSHYFHRKNSVGIKQHPEGPFNEIRLHAQRRSQVLDEGIGMRNGTHPDKRVLLVIGDGSVGFNFMEFQTAIKNNLPIVVVVANDTLWGMIAHSQTLRLGHAIKDGTDIGVVHYEKLVEALGGFGAFVEKPEDIRPAIEAAFKSGKVACVNVMVDPSTISPGSVALANLGGYKVG